MYLPALPAWKGKAVNAPADGFCPPRDPSPPPFTAPFAPPIAPGLMEAKDPGFSQETHWNRAFCRLCSPFAFFKKNCF